VWYSIHTRKTLSAILGINASYGNQHHPAGEACRWSIEALLPLHHLDLDLHHHSRHHVLSGIFVQSVYLLVLRPATCFPIFSALESVGATIFQSCDRYGNLNDSRLRKDSFLIEHSASFCVYHAPHGSRICDSMALETCVMTQEHDLVKASFLRASED